MKRRDAIRRRLATTEICRNNWLVVMSFARGARRNGSFRTRPVPERLFAVMAEDWKPNSNVLRFVLASSRISVFICLLDDTLDPTISRVANAVAK